MHMGCFEGLYVNFVDKKQMVTYTSNDIIFKILILLNMFSNVSNWCVNIDFVVP